ncbi:MAG: hypothetical protein P8K80_00415 [Phycisphaerales bacterium]|nr:hypothetical protein [Phycisphaerales bacterium]
MSESSSEKGPYDIQEHGAGAPPELWGEIAVRDSADDLLDFLSAELLIEAQSRIRAHDAFHLAIAWTDTVARFMERMMYDPAIRQFPWARTHCWLLNDTRTDDCYIRLRDILVPHSGIDEANMHGADAREDGPVFDYAMLDVGPDGRAGAMGDEVRDSEVLVPLDRINRTGFVALLAMGSDVQATLQSLEKASGVLPVQSVRSDSGTTRWYLSPTTPDDEAEPFKD